MKKEAAELFVAKFMHTSRYCIFISKSGAPRLSGSKLHGSLTPLSVDLLAICTDLYLLELFFNFDYNLKKVLMAVRRSHEVNWTSLRETMMYPFKPYDWDSGEVYDLPIAEEREFSIRVDNLGSGACGYFHLSKFRM